MKLNKSCIEWNWRKNWDWDSRENIQNQFAQIKQDILQRLLKLSSIRLKKD